MNKKLMNIAILGTITFSSMILPIVSHADSVETQIQEQDSKINSLKSKSTSVQSDLETVESSISNNEAKAKGLLKEIQAANSEMKQLDEDITTLTAKIDQRNDQLKEQARSVQVTGDSQNYLEFIISAESLSDVIGRIDVVGKMVSANRGLVQQQVADKEAVKTKKDETQKKVNQQNTLAGQLESTQSKLEKQKMEKEVVVAQLAADTATAEGDKAKFLAQKAEAEKQVAAFTSAKEESAKAVQLASATTKETADSSSTKDSEQSAPTLVANNNGTSGNSTPTPTPTPTPVKPDPTPVKPDPAPVKPDPEPVKPTPPAGGGASWSNLQAIANPLQGIPYLLGGTTTNGFDCSGFTQYVFARAGISIPRVASAQYAASTKVSNPQPGDLVFFSQSGGEIDHVGIYAGGSTFIGSQSSSGVAYANYAYYWDKFIVGYGRY
ncbi:MULTISPECIES: C40 family peptidase [Carnobacterium]|uniref:C40 family peptidase n=1 Tax=Carnobacterium TaxID=2747 RepID=UPI002890DFC1|nr:MULTISPECIES: NlpC/P60 family protein [Carnobacterium]MDT1939305.1 NlpC/P60 family protein [Carnobacterium divergens]MDT1941743.1 NlpC/P60 family protein [Carnobacterium divergens]MDT1947541.1 NlpC/P60 family protein [Carnobacterium divergens]MDT1949980.1 NlpC/P60 family protein [Carnobacterium divergens]MDT1955158.1 NlpC/P60 family protein [Carnobacterium divergens]